jgi:hypothetical protein
MADQGGAAMFQHFEYFDPEKSVSASILVIPFDDRALAARGMDYGEISRPLCSSMDSTSLAQDQHLVQMPETSFGTRSTPSGAKTSSMAFRDR